MSQDKCFNELIWRGYESLSKEYDEADDESILAC